MTTPRTNRVELGAKGPLYAKMDAETPSKAKSNLQLVGGPNHQNTQSARTPRRPKNKDVRPREYLTENEVQRLREAAKKAGRYGQRDELIISLLWLHGFRVSELCDLQWTHINFEEASMQIKRKKGSKDGVHPIDGEELRALRRHRKRQTTASPFVFTTERGGPFSSRAVQTIVARAGQLAQIGFPVHPHMLRHAAGYALANSSYDTRCIQELLGHRNIQHTVRYAEITPNRLKETRRALRYR